MITQRIVVSLVITVAVSVIFSLFLLNFNFNFFASFAFFTLLQFVGFYFYGEFIKRKNAKMALEAELKSLEFFQKISTEVVCPCDKNVTTTIPVALNQKNYYTCSGCNKRISVYLEPKTALVTEPQDESSLDDPRFVSHVNELIRSQQSNVI